MIKIVCHSIEGTTRVASALVTGWKHRDVWSKDSGKVHVEPRTRQSQTTNWRGLLSEECAPILRPRTISLSHFTLLNLILSFILYSFTQRNQSVSQSVSSWHFLLSFYSTQTYPFILRLTLFHGTRVFKIFKWVNHVSRVGKPLGS